jgi:hypothetical protein
MQSLAGYLKGRSHSGKTSDDSTLGVSGIILGGIQELIATRGFACHISDGTRLLAQRAHHQRPRPGQTAEARRASRRGGR